MRRIWNIANLGGSVGGSGVEGDEFVKLGLSGVSSMPIGWINWQLSARSTSSHVGQENDRKMMTT